MHFVYPGRFPAMLLRTVIDEQRLAASVLTRVTYDIHGQRLIPSTLQDYIVSQAPWDSPRGAFEADQPFKTGGVDIFVFGSAHAPAGRQTTSSTVSVIVGKLRRDVRVFGPRVWQRSGGALVPSRPQPFTSVPLTLKSAFGGTCVWDEAQVPWPDNPEGLGFYLDEKEAEGRPLPLLEDPARLIKKWDDRGPVVGFGLCPLQAGPRLAAAVEFDAERRALTAVTPRILNAAYPELVAPEVAPGTQVTLLGVNRPGKLEFLLPATLPRATLQLGDKTHERPLAIDQVGVDVEENKVFVTYRFPFRYRFVPEQQRAVTLEHAEV